MAANFKADRIYLTYNPEKQSWNVVSVLLLGDVYREVTDTSNIFSIRETVREFVITHHPKIAC